MELDKILTTYLKRVYISSPTPNSEKQKTLKSLISEYIKNRSKFSTQLFKSLDAGTLDSIDTGKVFAVLIENLSDGGILSPEDINNMSKRLVDGSFNFHDISRSLALATAARVSDDRARKLIEAAVTGQLRSKDLLDSLLSWISESNPDIGVAVKAAIESEEDFSVSSLSTLVTSYLVRKRKIELSADTTEDQLEALLKALQDPKNKGDFGDKLMELSKALIEKQELPKALIHLINAFDLADNETLVDQIINEEVKPRVTASLVGFISKNVEGIKEGQAEILARSLLRVLQGKEELLATETEQDALGMLDLKYSLWCRVRTVIYSVQLALKGGPIVPTAALAQPHVFARASISPKTLVHTSTTKKNWPLFLTLMSKFMQVEFGSEVGTHSFIKTPPVLLSDLETKMYSADNLLEAVIVNYRGA